MPDAADPLELLEAALENLNARHKADQLYLDYYEGNHRLLFATEKFRNAFGAMFQAFADNLCAPVVDALADRLKLRAFTGPGADQANLLWKASRMRRHAGEAILDALRRADSFLVVWPNAAGQPRVYVQEPTNCWVLYDEDEPGRIKAAAKVWPVADEKYRATIYLPDMVYRYETTNSVKNGRPDKVGLFTPYQDEDTPEGELVNRWGQVPMFHLANNAAPGRYGRSELADVIPLQDALNKTMADMLVAMEFVSLPQRYATGVEVETDPITGQPDPTKAPKVTPGAVWTVPDMGAAMGQFEPGDLRQFLEVAEAFRVEVARVSGVPQHLLSLTGEPPAGIALRVAEGRLVAKAEDRADSFGATLVDAIALALRMGAGTPDPAGQSDQQAQLEAVWEPAGTRDELYEVQVAQAKVDVGVSRDQALRELGYTDDQLAAMKDERETDAAELGAAMLASFDRGGTPVNGAQGAALNL